MENVEYKENNRKSGTHRLENEEKFGEVRIADEVVAIIAGLAASEIEGVASMAGNVTRDIIATTCPLPARRSRRESRQRSRP